MRHGRKHLPNLVLSGRAFRSPIQVKGKREAVQGCESIIAPKRVYLKGRLLRQSAKLIHYPYFCPPTEWNLKIYR